MEFVMTTVSDVDFIEGARFEHFFNSDGTKDSEQWRIY
jgi:hypothetical protein